MEHVYSYSLCSIHIHTTHIKHHYFASLSYVPKIMHSKISHLILQLCFTIPVQSFGRSRLKIFRQNRIHVHEGLGSENNVNSKSLLKSSFFDEDDDENSLFSGSGSLGEDVTDLRGEFSSDPLGDKDGRGNKSVKRNVDGQTIVTYNENAGDPGEFQKMTEMSEMSGPFDDHIPKFNTITLVGRLGSDPVAKYFDSGSVVVNVGLAVTRHYDPIERQVLGVKYGEEEADWFSLQIWGKDAEYLQNFATKGARVGVTGQFYISTYISKQTGETRTKPTIVVDTVDLLESKAESQLRRKNMGQQGNYGNSNKGGNRYNNDNDGLSDQGYSTGFKVNDDPTYPPSAGSGSFF